MTKNHVIGLLVISLAVSISYNGWQAGIIDQYQTAYTDMAEKARDARQRVQYQKDMRSLVRENYRTLQEKYRYVKAGGESVERLLVDRYKRVPAQARRFSKAIVKEAKRYRIDKWLLVAIGHQESRWRPDAHSWANAIGLMQIHARTWVGELLFVEARDDLWRPETNIRAGAAILRHYLDRFDGDYHAALEAYNGGPGCVGRCTQTAAYRSEVWSGYQEWRRL